MCLAPVSQASFRQKAECMLWHADLKTTVITATVLHTGWRRYKPETPTDKSVIQWFTQFKEEPYLPVSISTINQSSEHGVPETMIQNVLHNRLGFHCWFHETLNLWQWRLLTTGDIYGQTYLSHHQLHQSLDVRRVANVANFKTY
jgi:hypothetical protein